VIKRSCFS